MSQPLADVLAHAWSDFTPRRADLRPWWQPESVVDEVAYTGNVVVVPLMVADRAYVYGLDRPTDERDELEPFDWTPAGWGVSSP